MTLQVAEPGDPPTLCRVSPAHLSTQPHLSLQCFGVWGAQDTPRSDLLFAACWGGRGLGTPFRARLLFRGLWLQSLKLGIPSLALGVSPEHFWGSSLGFFLRSQMQPCVQRLGLGAHMELDHLGFCLIPFTLLLGGTGPCPLATPVPPSCQAAWVSLEGGAGEQEVLEALPTPSLWVGVGGQSWDTSSWEAGHLPGLCHQEAEPHYGGFPGYLRVGTSELLIGLGLSQECSLEDTPVLCHQAINAHSAIPRDPTR